MSAAPARTAWRGTLVDFTADPRVAGVAALRHVEDGLLVVQDGRIESAGPAAAALAQLPPVTPVNDQRGRIIMPGFIDAHVHYPQTDVIASHGKQLLDWLTDYTFPAEARFADPRHARRRGRVLSRSADRQRHHHRGGLCHRASASVDAISPPRKSAACG